MKIAVFAAMLGGWMIYVALTLREILQELRSLNAARDGEYP